MTCFPHLILWKCFARNLIDNFEDTWTSYVLHFFKEAARNLGKNISQQKFISCPLDWTKFPQIKSFNWIGGFQTCRNITENYNANHGKFFIYFVTNEIKDSAFFLLIKRNYCVIVYNWIQDHFKEKGDLKIISHFFLFKKEILKFFMNIILKFCESIEETVDKFC